MKSCTFSSQQIWEQTCERQCLHRLLNLKPRTRKMWKHIPEWAACTPSCRSHQAPLTTLWKTCILLCGKSWKKSNEDGKIKKLLLKGDGFNKISEWTAATHLHVWEFGWLDFDEGTGKSVTGIVTGEWKYPHAREPSCYQLEPWRGWLRDRQRQRQKN